MQGLQMSFLQVSLVIQIYSDPSVNLSVYTETSKLSTFQLNRFHFY